jgi:hypothetical protein
MAEVIQFEEISMSTLKENTGEIYKNTHLRFGYTKDGEPIFIFMVPSCGNTPGIPFDNDPVDQHKMMEFAFDRLIKNPTKETTKEFFKRVPLIFHGIYYLDDENNECFNHMNKEELKLFFIRIKKRLNEDNIISLIGYQTFY